MHCSQHNAIHRGYLIIANRVHFSHLLTSAKMATKTLYESRLSSTNDTFLRNFSPAVKASHVVECLRSCWKKQLFFISVASIWMLYNLPVQFNSFLSRFSCSRNVCSSRKIFTRRCYSNFPSLERSRLKVLARSVRVTCNFCTQHLRFLSSTAK